MHDYCCCLYISKYSSKAFWVYKLRIDVPNQLITNSCNDKPIICHFYHLMHHEKSTKVSNVDVWWTFEITRLQHNCNNGDNEYGYFTGPWISQKCHTAIKLVDDIGAATYIQSNLNHRLFEAFKWDNFMYTVYIFRHFF